MTRVEGILRNSRCTCLKGGKSKAIMLSTWLCVNYPGGGGGGGGREWRGQLAVITYGGREQ